MNRFFLFVRQPFRPALPALNLRELLRRLVIARGHIRRTLREALDTGIDFYSLFVIEPFMGSLLYEGIKPSITEPRSICFNLSKSGFRQYRQHNLRRYGVRHSCLCTYSQTGMSVPPFQDIKKTNMKEKKRLSHLSCTRDKYLSLQYISETEDIFTLDFTVIRVKQLRTKSNTLTNPS